MTSLSGIRDRWSVPALLVAGLLLSAGLAWHLKASNEQLIHDTVQEQAERVADRSVAQLERTTLGLRGTRGYLLGAGIDAVTAPGFREYFESRNLEREFPGVLGMGFIRRVAAASEAAYVQHVRAQGDPDFSIRFLSPHNGERRVIQWVEPVASNQAAVGLDVASEASRRHATDLALKTETGILTGPIRLVQSKPGSSLGLLVMIPLTDRGQPAGFGISEGPPGYVYSPIQLDDLLAAEGALPSTVLFDLWDVTPGNPAQNYELTLQGGAASPLPLTISLERQIMGRVWRFDVRPTQGLITTLHLTSPLSAFAGGAVVTVLLAALLQLRRILNRRTRAALEERIRLGTLLDNASDAIVGLDLEGRVQLWNQAATRLFGHTPQTAMGADLVELIGIDQHRGSDLDIFRQAAAGQTTPLQEKKRRHRDGHEVEVEVAASPILDADGQVVGVAKVFHPIRERLEQIRHLEAYGTQLEQRVSERTQALMAVSHDLRQVLDGVPALIGAGDLSHRVRFANRALATLLDTTPEAAMGRAWGTVLPVGLLERVQPAIESALAGHDQRLEIHWSKDLGTRGIHLDVRVIGERQEDGDVTGFFLMAHDITTLKAVLAQLEASEARLRRLYRATPAMLHTVDQGGRLQEVSDFWLQKLGYHRDEVIGRPSLEFLVADCRAIARDHIRQVFQEGTSVGPVPLQMLAKDGEVIDINLWASRDAGDQGRTPVALAMIEDVTLRLRAERELLAEQTRLSNIIDGTGAGTWEWNVATGETRFNERWAAIIGWTLDELSPVSTDTWVQHVHPDDLLRSNEGLRRHFAGETDRFDCEARMRHRDGHWVWIHSRGRVLSRGANGKPEWMFGTHMDITERKRSEQELAEQHKVMTAVLQAAPIAVRVARLSDNQVLMVNEQYARMVRRQPQEAIGLDISRLYVHPEEYTDIRNQLAEGNTVSNRLLEIHLPDRPDASHIWVQGSYMPIDFAGEPSALAWLYDVTELRRARDAARQSQEVQAQALDATLAGLAIFDASDRLEVINQRMLDIYPEAAPQLRPGIPFETFARAITLAYRNPDDPTTDLWVRDRLRSHRPGSTWMRRLADGRTIRVVERELSAGKFVSLRTDVTELVKAQEAAEAASRAKSEFLASTSHEIRTPLNAILGLAYLLEHENLPAPALAQVRRLSQAGRSLLSLINDVLDLSKIEAGQVWIDTEPVPLGELVSEEVALLSEGLRNDDLEVTLHVDPDLPAVVMGDGQRLRQILNNLVGNAIKFTARGEVCLSVRPGAHAPMIEFEVRDTGIGIHPDLQQRLFRPFEQGDSSVGRRFGGTGLGLSITSRLVGMMGGTIGLESQPGEGATFNVSLPLPPAPTAGAGRSGMRILLLDSDTGSARALTAALETLGWWAVPVTDLSEARRELLGASLTGAPFDAVLLHSLPDSDLWQGAVANLREALPAAHGPVFIGVDDTGRSAREGAGIQLDGWLQPPVTASALYDAVNRLMTSLGATRGAAPSRGETGEGDVAWLHGLQLLVVDDSSINLEVARKILEMEGAQVDTAESGPIALTLITEAPDRYDAVLLDIMMPDMDGIEVVRRIRAQAPLRDLPVVALTAGVLREQRDAAMQAGMTDFMSKPLDPSRVVACLRRHIEYRRGAPPAVAPRRPGQTVAAGASPVGVDGLNEQDIAPSLRQDRALLLTMVRRLVGEFARLPGTDASDLGARLHKLKGGALTIGAREVAMAAAAAEKVLRASPQAPELPALLDQVEQAVARLDRWIAVQVPHDAATSDTAAPPSTAVPTIDDAQWSELCGLIEAHSTRALALVERLRQPLTGRLGPSSFDALLNALRLFDFDAAEAIVAP